jgi:hypothetical protein
MVKLPNTDDSSVNTISIGNNPQTNLESESASVNDNMEGQSQTHGETTTNQLYFHSPLPQIILLSLIAFFGPGM